MTSKNRIPSNGGESDTAYGNRDIVLADPAHYDYSVPPSLQQAVLVVKERPENQSGGGAGSTQLESRYDRGRKLGQGAFAHVFAGRHKQTKAEYAVKKIDRSKMIWDNHDQAPSKKENHQRDALEDEINTLIAVRNGPYIVQLYEVYEERHHCFLIMELMHGGELFDQILERKIFTEQEAGQTMSCILQALNFMHDNKHHRIAHRDLKPENLLLTQNSFADPLNPVIEVKLADFGFAKRVLKQNGLRTLCGTPGYLAPEILQKFPAYDTSCDLWSVGVIMFLLLGGYLPFEDDDEVKVFDRTRAGQYAFHPAYWKTVSTSAKNLVTKLLTVNPKKRFSAQQALNHEWMVAMASGGTAPGTVDESPGVTPSSLVKNKAKAGPRKATVDSNKMRNLNDRFQGFLEDKQKNPTTKTRIKTDEGGDGGGGGNSGGGNAVVSASGHGASSRQQQHPEDSKTGKPFDAFYVLGDLLGEGGYAFVYRAVHKRTKDVYAVKDVNTSVLERSTLSSLKDEIEAMKLLRGGPHIVRLYDVFEEPDHLFMVMEECQGGDLLTRVTEKEVYTEREARKTCQIIFEAMDYIHTMVRTPG
jgi:calcium/calmodulin-dependent protein kinase I